MKFAVVHNWPGQRNSELELIKRIARITGDLGHECTVIDPFGHILNDDGEHLDTLTFIDSRKYDFCLNLHYVNPNFFDTFSYAVNWNPLDYVVRHPIDSSDLPADHIAYRTACLESHDALLSAGSEEMDDFAASLNLVTRVHIVNSNLLLHTTSDVADDLDFPDFRDFRIFYIGANWERQKGVTRHSGLIERLDETNIFDFFGLNNQHGISLWEDVRNYRGELPFDGGKSILDQANQRGVSLVLHSGPHRKSALASTRIFQACAAKTLTICDSNPFIREHFGNSVLSFEYSDKPAENFGRIMERVAWIRRHPGKATEMARKAHNIFVEKFSLREEVSNLFSNHEANKTEYLREFGASDTSVTVDVLYVHESRQNALLDIFFADLVAQVGVHPRGVVFVSSGHAEEVCDASSRLGIECEVVMWDSGAEQGLSMEGGLVSRYLRAHTRSSWFTFYSNRCRWKRFHLAPLVRAAEAGNAVTMSGTFVENNAFSDLIDDYYLLSKNSIGQHPRAITEQDIGGFDAERFSPSSLLFDTSFFQNERLIRSLRFFDKGWAFFLVVWYYIQRHKLPFFVPKLTTIFIRNDRRWDLDVYLEGKQTKDFERSLAHAFLKNDPDYLSVSRLGNVANSGNSALFSVNDYMLNILQFRPLLLRAYRFFFRVTCFILGLSYEGSTSERQNRL